MFNFSRHIIFQIPINYKRKCFLSPTARFFPGHWAHLRHRHRSDRRSLGKVESSVVRLRKSRPKTSKILFIFPPWTMKTIRHKYSLGKNLFSATFCVYKSPISEKDFSPLGDLFKRLILALIDILIFSACKQWRGKLAKKKNSR